MPIIIKDSQLGKSQMIERIILFGGLASILFLSGCSTKQATVKRYFFPPLPNDPKVEWLARYTSKDDFPKSDTQLFMESIVGKDSQQRFKRPWGIASDGKGKVYVADTHGGFVRIFNMNDKTVKELGGGEDEGESVFESPIDVDLDKEDNVYVSESKRGKVFEFSRDDKPVRNFESTDPELKVPAGIGVDRKLNRLYVVYARSHKIAVFDLVSGAQLQIMGGRGQREGEFNFPTDVAVDSKSNIIVTDTMNGRIQIFDRDYKFVRAFGKFGDGAIEFQLIRSVAVNRDDLIFITDSRHQRVMVFNEDGQSLLNFGAEDSLGQYIGGFNLPQGIFIDKDEMLYVADALNKRFHIYKIINEEWLKEHPIKESEAAKVMEQPDDKGKKK